MKILNIVLILLLLGSPTWAWQLVGSGVTTSAPLSVSDNFNRSNGTSCDTTGNWTHPHDPDTTYADLISWDNQLAGTSSRSQYAYWSANTFSANQKVCATVKVLGTGGPAVRITSGIGITAYAVYTSSGNYIIKKHVQSTNAASGTTLATFSAQTVNDLVCLSASGTSSTTLTLTLNGTPQTEYIDSSTPITSGQPGFLSYSNIVRHDDWTADEL